MRAWLQLGIVAVLGGAGYLWHTQADAWGVPAPLSLLGLERPTVAEGPRGAPAAQQVAVVAAPVRQAAVVERMESVGTVRAREAVTITTKVAGMVTAIRFEEGAHVRAGEVLMELDSEALYAELYQARASLDNAQSQLARARALPAGQAVARARVDELETLSRAADGRLRQIQARIDELRLTAPFDGRVGLRQVSAGALIQPGTPVTSLDDISRVRVEFSIPEVHVARVRPGSLVSARSAAHGSRVFEGRVTVMDTRIDTATRTMRVISEFDNSDEALRPGLFLNVQLTLETRPTALLVPEEALDSLGERSFVYAIRDGRARRVEVQLGLRLAGEVEIREGVRPDDQVVVRGLQRLRPDMPVRVTETMTRPTS
ncbi:efflux RND transporter periplasmic adaptor subunit [Roseococcus suduntuyensis]|uniref:Membrane fusion protein (Multidrug efflux system) n=1 Tax=Roseococcus suduntuyensis TaxID=455361 RepID=A0A840AE60_9PROT|nr:efflux RND transporter periplasmic adaptor subunit [Roseococcus suduntuyensis]MBB3899909.1 membrane fusion protein (multidrug efflux system) [Roseococcus suduntuyensis]